MNIQQIIKKNLLAIIAVATVIGFSSFKIYEKSSMTDVVFRYQQPESELHPFSAPNVKTLANWKDDSSQCPTTDDEVACSIMVPIENTINSQGKELDPNKVTISTQQATPNNHGVTSGVGYSNPVNRTQP